MRSKKQMTQNLSWMPQKVLLIALVVFSSSCAMSGPAITGCVVDVASEGYQCVTYPDKKSFLPFIEGGNLICTSPEDLEDYLKACKQHKLININLCKLDVFNRKFNCKDPDGEEFQVPLKATNNFFCLSKQDKKRADQRCVSNDIFI